MVEKLQLTEFIGKCTKIQTVTLTDETSFPNIGAQFVLKAFTQNVNDERLIEEMRFVVSELVTNAFYHGNRFERDKKIKIYCGWIGKEFYGAIQDEGKGFDIDNPSYHAGPPDGGMGIELSRMRVDLLYNFGNTVFFVKRVT